jgi:hypothetical protein
MAFSYRRRELNIIVYLLSESCVYSKKNVDCEGRISKETTVKFGEEIANQKTPLFMTQQEP